MATGRFPLPEPDPVIDRVRAAHAHLKGVSADDVAIGTHASPFVGTVAVNPPPAFGALALADEPIGICAEHGARLLVDTTRSAGRLLLDASRIDYTVCSAFT